MTNIGRRQHEATSLMMEAMKKVNTACRVTLRRESPIR